MSSILPRGSGYGSLILKKGGAEDVVGPDLAPQASWVSHSDRHVLRCVCSLDAISVRDSSMDVIVSFETIEHVEADQLEFRNSARVLRPGGLLLLSTPNRVVSSPHLDSCNEGQPTNPFHLREYSRAELRTLLSPHFLVQSEYGQEFRLVPKKPRHLVIRQIHSMLIRMQRGRVWHAPIRRLDPEIMVVVAAVVK